MAGVISLFWLIPGNHIINLSIWEFFVSGTLGTAVFVGLMYAYIRINPRYGTGMTLSELKMLIMPKNK